MMRLLLFTFSFLIMINLPAQTQETGELPYKQIPDSPENYSSGNIISRIIDGLGYRYYWATEGLTENDLRFTPSNNSRSTYETIEHIYELSEIIVNSPLNLPNFRPLDLSAMDFTQLRRQTLLNLQKASKLFLGKSENEIINYSIIFQRGENKIEYPYWNMINGPLSDAIYHTGQIVSFRRTSGNPLNPNVNVFTGKTAE